MHISESALWVYFALFVCDCVYFHDMRINGTCNKRVTLFSTITKIAHCKLATWGKLAEGQANILTSAWFCVILNALRKSIQPSIVSIRWYACGYIYLQLWNTIFKQNSKQSLKLQLDTFKIQLKKNFFCSQLPIHIVLTVSWKVDYKSSFTTAELFYSKSASKYVFGYTGIIAASL